MKKDNEPLLQFESDDEAYFWRDVYVSAIRSPTDVTVSEKRATLSAFADGALSNYRKRAETLRRSGPGPKGGPYR